MFRKSQNEENVRKREDLLAILMSHFFTKYRKMIVYVRNSILTNKDWDVRNGPHISIINIKNNLLK